MITPLDLIIWLLLLLTLGAGTTVAVLSFLRPNHLLTWLAAGALLVALLFAWLARPDVPAVVDLVVAVVATGLAVLGGGPAARLALDLATKGSVREGIHGGIVVPQDARDAQGVLYRTDREVLRGGTTIGVLERFATVASVIAGLPEALAVIVAVKGVGRFTELESSEARERFIIGTFASLIWACVCGAVVRLVIA
ncbi:hypothetical protein WDJ51_09470 [Rathayibacter sp. YIM 133350]|uniref:hypothetical protein n=1 Tax=Rathayibacter sp. YIM 133350 TaxID=3131992 RepID=UPI00307D86F8